MTLREYIARLQEFGEDWMSVEVVTFSGLDMKYGSAPEPMSGLVRENEADQKFKVGERVIVID